MRLRWRRRVMRRRRRRIVRCGRRPCLIQRALVIGLGRRIRYARPLVQGLRQSLGNALRRCHNRSPLRLRWPSVLGLRLRRPSVLGLHAARRIVARQVGAIDGRSWAGSRKRATQNRARSRCCAPGTGKSLLANIYTANWGDGTPIKIQRLLMIRSGHGSVVEGPWALGNWSTIDHNQTPR